MKKVLSLLLAAAMVFTFGACAPKEKAGTETPDTPAQQQTPGTPAEPETPEAPAEKIDIRVAALKGPTAMGMVKLMDDAEKGEGANNYIFTLAGAPDELTGPIIQGEFDIAAVPTNLAAVLYNKTEGKVKLAALNTLGVLYVVERGDTIQSVADLKGKTIYSSGQGAVPEYALNYVLEKNGLKPGEDVTVEYKSEHAEIATLLAAGNAQVALLPQPFVTATLAQNENLRVALDLTEAWDAATGGESTLTMGAILVNAAFAQEHPDAVAAFLDEYKASVEYTNGTDTIADAAALVEKYGIVAKAALAQKAIPACNIVFIDGEEMQKLASGFFQVLYDANPQSVGGKLPDEAIYYKR